jgi:hypothetical protein
MKLFFTFVLSLFIMAGQAQNLIIEHPVARQARGGMYVHSIEISDTSTIVNAYCTNATYRPSALISTAPPNTNDAFRLIADRHFFKLKAIDGIPLSPESVTLNFGDTAFFKMLFEPIPKNTQVIDLVEGASIVESAWMVFGIQMITPTKTKETHSIFQNKTDFKNYYKRNLLALWDIEGFWKVAFLYTESKNGEKQILFDYQEVAIVRENNYFQVYNLQGEKIERMYFNHLKKERYTYVLTTSNLYPIQVNFNFKPNFNLNFLLSKKYQKSLLVQSNTNKINCTFDWQFQGR